MSLDYLSPLLFWNHQSIRAMQAGRPQRAAARRRHLMPAAARLSRPSERPPHSKRSLSSLPLAVHPGPVLVAVRTAQTTRLALLAGKPWVAATVPAKHRQSKPMNASHPKHERRDRPDRHRMPVCIEVRQPVQLRCHGGGTEAGGREPDALNLGSALASLVALPDCAAGAGQGLWLEVGVQGVLCTRLRCPVPSRVEHCR